MSRQDMRVSLIPLSSLAEVQPKTKSPACVVARLLYPIPSLRLNEQPEGRRTSSYSLSGWLDLADLRPEFVFRLAQVIRGLHVHPELRGRVKEPRQPQCGVNRDPRRSRAMSLTRERVIWICRASW